MNTTLTLPTLSPQRPIIRSDPRVDAWMEWRADTPEEPNRLTIAELDECRCPDLCNRDHVNE